MKPKARTVQFPARSDSRKKRPRSKVSFQTLNISRQKLKFLFKKSNFKLNNFGAGMGDPRLLKLIYGRKYREKIKGMPRLFVEAKAKAKRKSRRAGGEQRKRKRSRGKENSVPKKGLGRALVSGKRFPLQQQKLKVSAAPE